MSEPTEGIVEANFVRKEWYVEPPAKGATPEVWAAWLEADRKAAIAAKRAFTLAQKHGEAPESARPTVTAKIGGVWKQTALVGLTGSAEDDALTIEAAVDADQDRTLATAHFRHGGRGSAGSQRASGAARRKAKRKARKASRQ